MFVTNFRSFPDISWQELLNMRSTNTKMKSPDNEDWEYKVINGSKTLIYKVREVWRPGILLL